ncbi:MAG: glycosyltransferase [bacterium]|nr:glycosyltransferase [bacterium]
MKTILGSSFKPCAIVPYYNHGKRILAVVAALEKIGLPVIVVDDGCDDPESLATLKDLKSSVILIRHSHNSGKGAALVSAMQDSVTRGYTHALAVDSDGQHNSHDAQEFLKQARANPKAIILGLPTFDENAPWERVWGRKLSTMLVRLQTRSKQVSDILCGLRVYPLVQTHVLLNRIISLRMGFDIEIVVRFIWNKGQVIHVKTLVVYPPDGLSHFHYLRDNLALTGLHVRLLLESVLPQRSEEWFDRRELGSSFGLRILLWVYLLLGRRGMRLVLYPICFFFLFFARRARIAILESRKHFNNQGVAVSSPYHHVFRTFLLFAYSMLDAIRGWRGEIDVRLVKFENAELVYEQIATGKGAVVFTAHFGPIEASRALQRTKKNMRLYALMYLKNAMKFRGLLELVMPGAHADVLGVESLDVAALISIREKIDQGALLGVMGDRSAPGSSERFLEHQFFGEVARFPEGPFVLAAVLQVPVFAVVTAYQADSDEFLVKWCRFNLDNEATREKRVQEIFQQYVSFLENNCRKWPEQFFNFHNPWHKGSS